MSVLAISNLKGGVGKTTTAVNLGISLAAAEQKTLLIDMDPQGNASTGLGITRNQRSSTLYGALLGEHSLGAAIRQRVHLRDLDVVPATQDLAGSEVELVGLSDPYLRLRNALKDIRHLYDFVLIDCPPSSGILTINALAAADSVMIPLQTEFFAMEGIADFLAILEWVQANLNPRLGLEGVLLTLHDHRLTLSREVEEEARSVFQDRLLRTRIPRNVRLAEAPSHGTPALLYDAGSPGAQAYLRLAQEVIARSPLQYIDGNPFPWRAREGAHEDSGATATSYR